MDTKNTPQAAKRKPMAQRPGDTNIRPYFTTRDGRRVYASEYGHRGWPIGKRNKQ